MKSFFYYLLALALATSSLVAGPKPEPTKPFGFSGRADPKNECESSQEKTAALRRQSDPLPSDDDSSYQDRDPSPTANITESESDISKLDPHSNSDPNRNMDASSLTSHLIEDYIPGSSSPHDEESKSPSPSADGRIQAVTPSSSTTRDLDLQRKLFQRKAAEVKGAETTLHEVSEAKLKNPKFVLHSVAAKRIPGVHPPKSKKLEAARAAVEEAHEDLENIAAQLGATRVEDLFSQIEEDPKKIHVFNTDQGVRESAPIAQSFHFGVLIQRELQQLQQKTIANKLAGNVGPYGKSDPFGDMLVDLGRTHKNNAIYSLTEGTTTTHLNRERGQDNLNAFKQFVGENNHLQIAIASIMHQGGQSDFESIKLGARRDPADQRSLPFFTEGVGKVLWRPDMDGPMLMKLFAGENHHEAQVYNLTKTITASGSPIFQLAILCTQSVTNTDFKYNLNRNVTYQFEVNPSFNSSHPISEENSPVTLTCLEGKIVQSFDDQRTPQQFAHQAAQYNLTVYQRRLDELGDPHQIETEYQQRIQFLASRAAARPGSIMTQDRNEAEAKLQALRKAQQDVQNAEQELREAQRLLDGTSDDETDSQSGFASDTDDEG